MITETADYTIHDFRIKSRSADGYSMSTHHFHDVYEIYYMNSGSRDYFLNDSTQRVHQGDLVFVKPQDLHKTIDTGESHSRILISFRSGFLPFHDMGDIIENCFAASKVLSFDLIAQSELENQLRNIIITANANRPFVRPELQCQLSYLLITTARYLNAAKNNDIDSTPANQKVHDIIQYLKANYQRAITLDSLAEEFYLSRFHLTRVFKKATGFTIFEYLHSLRVIEAQRLLRKPKIKIIDIAHAVGFANVSNFGKVFKSVTGISPSNYRKQHK